MSNPKVELTLPVMQDMELAATKTAEVVAKQMGLDEMKTAEINMALIEACINAFEHSKSDSNVYIHYIIEDDTLILKVGLMKLVLKNYLEKKNIMNLFGN